MIYELGKAGCEKVRSLFQALEFQLMSVAVLDDNRSGKVFADDPTNPQTAFIFTPQVWCYLAGNPDNDSFNRALNQAIYAGGIFDKGVDVLFLACHPESWEEQLVVALGRQPIPMCRRYYVCRELKYDWRANVPDGFSVHRIAEALLNRPGLIIPRPVKDWMEEWGSITNFLERGFGFVTIHDDSNKVVSWSLADGISGNTCEIGIFTISAFRRRGLATITTAAVVDYALSNGWMVGWDCAEDNLNSIRTAEKVGFEKERNHIKYYVLLKEADHAAEGRMHKRRAASALAQKGEDAFRARRYQEAADFYEWVFTLQDNSEPSHRHLAARAWAALGDRDQAFEYLNAAADGGWDYVYHTRVCKEFKYLRSTPEWAAVLERIQQNKKDV